MEFSQQIASFKSRPLHRGDATALADFYKRNWAYLKPWLPALAVHSQNPEVAKDMVARYLREIVEGYSAYFVLAEPQTNQILGRCNITQIARGPFNACYLGYCLDQSLQGRGLMRKMCAQVIEHAFTGLKLHRIMANYMPHNNRSARLLKSLGFKVEGLARDYLEINGKWENHVLTALTRET